MIRLAPGQKPPAGSSVTLCQGSGDSRREVEFFDADQNPEWVCPQTARGFWYGYTRADELARFVADADAAAAEERARRGEE